MFFQRKKMSLIFKDSLRVFPLSLNDLCKTFNVEGKLFNDKPEFNNIKILINLS